MHKQFLLINTALVHYSSLRGTLCCLDGAGISPSACINISFELCRGFSVKSVSLRQCSSKCKPKQRCWSDAVWLLLTQMDKQAAPGDVLQAACYRSAAGVWERMDDLFRASVLSANGMSLQTGGASLPWCLLMHLGQLPGSVFGVSVGAMQHAGLFALTSCAVSKQSASTQCRAYKHLRTSFRFQ
jgi:hypothetical protein